VQEFAELLIFALEELKEYRHDNCGGYQVLASEDLQTCDHGHPGLWIQDCVVLLEHIDKLIRKISHDLLFVLSANVAEK
jgi:hypothetical protein